MFEAKNLPLRWENKGRDLFVGDKKVATIATDERYRALYHVWTDLPGELGIDDIKGIAQARKQAEQMVRQWFLPCFINKP